MSEASVAGPTLLPTASACRRWYSATAPASEAPYTTRVATPAPPSPVASAGVNGTTSM
ncbi:MAG: hypothetical protein ABI664_15705 [bacterium]